MSGVGGPSFLRLACGSVFWLLLLSAPASAQLCDWCGCRGGPGYRAPNGHCVGWKQLSHVCGDPPSKYCTYEGNVNGPVLNAAPALLPNPSDSVPKAQGEIKSPENTEPAQKLDAASTADPAGERNAPTGAPPMPNEPPQSTEPPRQVEPLKLGGPLPPLNPAVTEATLQSTTCVHGWTATVRPSFFASQQLKLEKMKALGATEATAYELDHIIPLCLGGSPNDPKNLQLQPWAEATRKDRLEAQACRCVCAGIVPLAEARADLAADWQSAYHKYAKLTCHPGRK